MILIDPRDDSEPPLMMQMLDITYRYTGVNELVTNRQDSDINHPQNIYQLRS